jgi:hypothetical protein
MQIEQAVKRPTACSSFLHPSSHSWEGHRFSSQPGAKSKGAAKAADSIHDPQGTDNPLVWGGRSCPPPPSLGVLKLSEVCFSFLRRAGISHSLFVR